MTQYLELYINRLCTYSQRDPEPYGNHEDRFDNTCPGFAKLSKNKYGEPLAFKVEPGDTVFCLWVEYDTGDSFGRNYDGSVDIIHLFKDYNDASKVRKDLMNHDFGNDFYNEKSASKFTYHDEAGVEHTVYPGWCGYFEGNPKFHIDEVIVQK